MSGQALAIALETWAILGDMAPYLLFGFGVAGALSVMLSPETVEKHLGGHGLWPVVKATLFGIPLPLCSCGVIPVSASLRRHGATRGATTAFLLSTPQTGVDSIFVTLGLLGPLFAIFRPIAALVAGIVGGAVVTAADKESLEDAEDNACQEECCTGKDKGGPVYRAAHYAFVTLPADIGKPLMIGLLAVGLISAFVPDDFFAGTVGTGLGAMIAMMVLGLPMYVCATASVPIAVALIAKGVTPGAAFVFLMTGPATNAAAIATIWKVMGSRTAIIYLATVMLTALSAGLTLDYLFVVTEATATPVMAAMLPGYIKTASAFALIAMLVNAVLRPHKHNNQEPHPLAAGEEITVLGITGMTCSHCANGVERALLACTGVGAVEVELAAGQARVHGSGLDPQEQIRAIEGLGHTAVVKESER